jgi:hypothetical protein
LRGGEDVSASPPESADPPDRSQCPSDVIDVFEEEMRPGSLEYPQLAAIDADGSTNPGPDAPLLEGGTRRLGARSQGLGVRSRAAGYGHRTDHVVNHVRTMTIGPLEVALALDVTEP